MLRGGKFAAGFVSGFASHVAAPILRGANKYIRTAKAAILGGTVSALVGGKFANGAISGAFVHLFNTESSLNKLESTLAKLRTTNGFVEAEIAATQRFGKLTYEIGSTGSSSLNGRIIIDPNDIGVDVPSNGILDFPEAITNLEGEAYWSAVEQFEQVHSFTTLIWERVVTHELIHSAYGSMNGLINDHRMIIERTNEIVGFNFGQTDRSTSDDTRYIH